MSVRKREWTTAKGEEKSAWIVDYFDTKGVRRLKTFAKKKDADQFAATAKIEVREGTHVADRDSSTVKQAGKFWISSGEAAGLERATIEQRKQHLKFHIEPLIGTPSFPASMSRRSAISRTGCALTAAARRWSKRCWGP